MTDATLINDLKRGGKKRQADALVMLEINPSSTASRNLIKAALLAPQGRSIGVTGPPGVGKSSLTNRLVAKVRAEGKSVAVIAVDPSSRHGGAILGDRTRMRFDPSDQGVFIRSMAARGALGGVSDFTISALILFLALYDVVFIETVGVGQNEIAIAELATTVLFCAQPAAGDAIQHMKSGIMDIPDFIAITKADLGLIAEQSQREIEAALMMRGLKAQVFAVSSDTGEGVDALCHTMLTVKSSARSLNLLKSLAEARLKALASQVVSSKIKELNVSFESMDQVLDLAFSARFCLATQKTQSVEGF